MRLYEYQGKQLFSEMQIPVPEGGIAKTAEEAVEKSKQLGCPVVIKAQVLRGGRGKAGLIKTADSPEAAAVAAAEILGEIGPEVMLLVEKAVKADLEGYLGITVDDLNGSPVMVISTQGGIHVEETAENDKSKIISTHIDPEKGIYQHQIIGLAKKAGFESGIAVKIAEMGYKLYQTFVRYDCDTAEINPVMINSEARTIVAGDAKVIIDEYAFPRQPEIIAFRRERNLNESGIFFVDLGGNIGIISGGASGTMMLCDSIKVMGGEPANFLDGTGGNSAKSVAEKSKIVLAEAAVNPRYKVLMFNFNLTASSLKEIINGVIMAVKEIPAKVPVVASIRASGAATNDMSLEEARIKLEEYGIILSPTLEDAINSAIRLSKQ